ncbi:hypothetical protein BH11PLA2_BH11PLA2_35740 [soil metagenome]
MNHRIAIIGTPRTGNTWLRRLLSSGYELQERSVHRPDELIWNDLPANVVVQIHWPPTPEFLALLKHHQFQVVTLSRHPLDVLISILHFCRFEPETCRWLDGAGGNEDGIRGCTPLSREFAEYATGPRAAALLQLTRQWVQTGAIRVRYENLVVDTAEELIRIGKSLGWPVRNEVICFSVDANTMNSLRQSLNTHHFWQGQPGLWKLFLTADACRPITDAHAELFRQLEYRYDPNPNLNAAAAAVQWQRFHEVK